MCFASILFLCHTSCLVIPGADTGGVTRRAVPGPAPEQRRHLRADFPAGAQAGVHAHLRHVPTRHHWQGKERWFFTFAFVYRKYSRKRRTRT